MTPQKLVGVDVRSCPFYMCSAQVRYRGGDEEDGRSPKGWPGGIKVAGRRGRSGGFNVGPWNTRTLDGSDGSSASSSALPSFRVGIDSLLLCSRFVELANLKYGKMGTLSGDTAIMRVAKAEHFLSQSWSPTHLTSRAELAGSWHRAVEYCTYRTVP